MGERERSARERGTTRIPRTVVFGEPLRNTAIHAASHPCASIKRIYVHPAVRGPSVIIPNTQYVVSRVAGPRDWIPFRIQVETGTRFAL